MLINTWHFISYQTKTATTKMLSKQQTAKSIDIVMWFAGNSQSSFITYLLKAKHINFSLIFSINFVWISRWVFYISYAFAHTWAMMASIKSHQFPTKILKHKQIDIAMHIMVNERSNFHCAVNVVIMDIFDNDSAFSGKFSKEV